MSSVNYALEHFYYGQLADKPQGELQLLAASPGVQPDQIAEVIKQALIPPSVESPTGSWALIRGKKSFPFVLAQSQLSPTGQPTLHYILLNPDVLRAVGGNLRSLMGLVENPMPSFDKAGGVLKSLPFPQPEPVTDAVQIDDILDLMSYTHNRIDLIESMLAAVVQGVPLIIQHAPVELETRAKFVQGLLSLLPPSARFGVTFATHTLESTQTDAQLRFYGGEKLSRETLVYSWTRGKVGGNEVSDNYSHFIVGQLRLDPELATKQTRALTGVAAWRIKRGETLAEALSYAAYRLNIDNALLNNQPLESVDISKILAEDPTLTDDLKIAYTRHLLAFALALGDMSHAEPIASMLRQQPNLELAIQKQFGDSIQEGKGGIIYAALSRWMGNPLGPVGLKWVELTHRAALSHMEAMVKARDLKGIHTFLESIHHADPGLEISRVVPKLIEMALPLTALDKDLNLTTFLLAVNYLECDVILSMLKSHKFAAQLPPAFARFAPYVTGEDAGLAPSGILNNAASAFGEDWHDLILIRMAEASVRTKRPDILDTSALSAIMALLQTQWGVQYSQTLAWIARNMSTDEVLTRLETPGPTYILQILLSSGAYGELANEMLHQARLLYPGDKQNDYVMMVRRLFGETPIPTDHVPAALKTIGGQGIRSLPLAMAYIGALEGHEWSSALDPVAEEATTLFFDNPAILEVIPSTAMIALLKFHISRKDVQNTIRVAGLLPRVAIREGNKGVSLIGRMYKMLDWDDRVRTAALELLRRYIRMAKDEDARAAVTAFGREFGVSVQQALEATYSIRRLMDSVDLVDYAEFLHGATNFLFDTAVAYVDKSKIPTVGALLNNLDSMGGGLSNEERKAISQETLGMGKAIVVLGDQWQTNRGRELDKYIDGLLQNKFAPASVLDVFWILGGYLTKGKRYPLKLQREGTPYALGERSAPQLHDEAKILNSLLRSAIRAFPPDKKMTLSVEAIRGEMDSLWGDIPLGKQREIVRDLAIDFQRLAELTAYIAANSNAKALEDNNGGGRKLEENKQQPKDALELYRFVGGYFKLRLK